MPFNKRKGSNSVVDLTNNASPLPPPLTTRSLGARANSPASSISSGSHRAKRARQNDHVVDVDALPESTQPVAGPSRLPREVIDVEEETKSWPEDICDGSYDQVRMTNYIKAKSADHGRNAVAGPSNQATSSDLPSAPSRGASSPPPPSNLLSTHTCPICFSAVTNACLTPCGHVLCGACLFAAVKGGIQRALEMAIPIGGDGTAARCPVCRAVLKDWDGRGRGVIPLKIRTVMTL